MTVDAWTATVLPMHMGALHRWETVLVLTIAFGPFLILTALMYGHRLRHRPDHTEQKDHPCA